MAALRIFVGALAFSCALPVAAAQGSRDIEITQPFAPATMPGAPTGAVYLTLHNKTKTPDQLVGATTQRAKRVELHAMSMTGNVMRMREVAAIDLPPGAQLRMRPASGHHRMLVGIAVPLAPGEEFPLTLQFRAAGTIEVKVKVEQVRARSPVDEHHHLH
jgi:copper(I)-binding protein